TVLLMVLPGCKKKEEGGTADPAAEQPTEAAAKDPAAEPAAAAGAEMRNKMKHCPSNVEGAQSSYEKTEAALVVTITHADAATLADIKDKAEHLASVAGKPEPEVKHSGQGTGGGAGGACPVGIKNTKVTVTG